MVKYLVGFRELDLGQNALGPFLLILKELRNCEVAIERSEELLSETRRR